MKKVYTENNIMLCDMMKSLLESNGIQCFLKNEAMSTAFGSVGYNIYQAYPELYVINDEDFDKAKELIDQQSKAENDAG